MFVLLHSSISTQTCDVSLSNRENPLRHSHCKKATETLFVHFSNRIFDLEKTYAVAVIDWIGNAYAIRTACSRSIGAPIHRRVSDYFIDHADAQC